MKWMDSRGGGECSRVGALIQIVESISDEMRVARCNNSRACPFIEILLVEEYICAALGCRKGTAWRRWLLLGETCAAVPRRGTAMDAAP
jgi:hypothetical protein